MCKAKQKVSKRFARTTITGPNGEIIQARINLATGEIKPFQYRKEKQLPKARPKANSEDRLPHWMVIPPPDYVSITPATKSKSRKTKANTSGIYLAEYESKDDATAEIPPLDAILDGASRLDTGKAKPVSQALLFHLMQRLETIDAASIQAFTGYSEQYSRRLAALLRVAVNAFESETER